MNEISTMDIETCLKATKMSAIDETDQIQLVHKLCLEVSNQIDDFIFNAVEEYGKRQHVIVNAEKIVKAIEAYDKYRFHDYKKDSNDIPIDDTDVLIYLKDGNVMLMDSHIFRTGQVSENVLGWRYIPKKETENEF